MYIKNLLKVHTTHVATSFGPADDDDAKPSRELEL